jgi:hypothetical protein
MKERPILFSAPMVRAILSGAKTQTRRAWATQPPMGTRVAFVPGETSSPYGKPCDRLYVREGFSGPYSLTGVPPREWPPGTPLYYWADGKEPPWGDWTKPKPGIHLPRWGSRILLEITDLRVERLQNISEEDAQAEGADASFVPPDGGMGPYWEGFRRLWSSINGAESWDANPWVWALSFKVIEHDAAL